MPRLQGPRQLCSHVGPVLRLFVCRNGQSSRFSPVSTHFIVFEISASNTSQSRTQIAHTTSLPPKINPRVKGGHAIRPLIPLAGCHASILGVKGPSTLHERGQGKTNSLLRVCRNLDNGSYLGPGISHLLLLSSSVPFAFALPAISLRAHQVHRAPSSISNISNITAIAAISTMSLLWTVITKRNNTRLML